ncbi:MAG TPA: hypothetical protein VFA94_03725 [Acidimicrobiales bacterium]|nr:hypothetical protein [Acidimicrobiales bacterium]
MTPYLQLRLWLREATAIERRMASFAMLALCALAVWALVPTTIHQHTLGLGPAVGTGASPGGATGAGDAGAATGQVGGGDAAAGAASGSAASGASSGAALAQASRSAQVTTTVPGRVGGPASGQAPLTASDRGVTPDSIKVGFTILNLAGVSQAGIAEDLRTDTADVINALVDNANKHGGVLGRKIVADAKPVDIINTDDQQAKCLAFTETDKVFAVIDTIEYVFRAARTCFPIQHQTPLLTLLPGGSDEIRKAYPLQASLSKDDNRVMKDYVLSAKEAGFFDPAKGFKKLGLLDDDCDPAVINDPNDGLKAYLAKLAGITSVDEFTVGCAIDQQEREPPHAAVQHRLDGVTNVMFVTTHVALEPYMNTAQSQGYKPTYYASDYEGVTLDIASHALNADQADGMRAVSEYHSGDPLKVPEAQACSKILTDHGLPGITSYNHDFEALVLCEHLDLFVKAASLAGPNLTRAGFGMAVQGVGTVNGTVEDLAVFNQRGKITGGDAVSTVEWRRSCSCWAQVTPFRAAYG